MAPAHPMFRLQRRMLRRLLRELADQAGPEDQDLVALGRRYLRPLLRLTRRRRLLPEPRSELLRAAAERDVLFLGDLHVLPRVQLEAVRLLAELTRARRPLVLALELLPASCQAEAERFTAGSEPAERFLARLHHRVRWPFPLMGYCAVLEQARALGVPLLAIDAARDRCRSLVEREELMAGRLAARRAQAPGAQILVLVGEFHLAPGCLPDRTLLRCHAAGLATRILRIHQNPEPLQWRLLGTTPTPEQVLRLDPDQFALNNSHPLVTADATLHHVLQQSGLDDTRDPADRMAWMLRDLADYLGLDQGQAPDFELLTPEPGETVDLLRRRGLGRSHATLCLRELMAFGSAVLPARHCILLASEHVNHWSEAAARYLHGRWHEPADGRSPAERFAAQVLSHAAGFLGSALYNPNRTPVGLLPLLRRACTRAPLAPAARAARALLRAWRGSAGSAGRLRLDATLHATSPLVAVVTARCLGHELGGRLAHAHARRELGRRELRTLLLETRDLGLLHRRLPAA